MNTVVIVSCRFEWQATLRLFPGVELHDSPFGQWFTATLAPGEADVPVVFFQGGWGKISAAASAQYVVDRWAPELLINLGTCGGFEGDVGRGEVLLVERAVVYDIIERMTDPETAIAHYTTDLDLSWLEGEPPQPVRRTLIVSADHDLIASELPALRARFGAVAGDWESGAIAWVAARNRVRTLILRGVSDLVGSQGGEAYDGNVHAFADGAAAVMQKLIHHLPAWIELGVRPPRAPSRARG